VVFWRTQIIPCQNVYSSENNAWIVKLFIEQILYYTYIYKYKRVYYELL
jgi:hypothetical protein